jgi:RHS repeat-associated protein
MEQTMMAKTNRKTASNQFIYRSTAFVARGIKTGTAVLALLICALAFSNTGYGQDNIKYTQGDVNDSATLSLGVPMGSYTGRGISVPISLNYSSSVWGIDYRDSIRGFAGVSLPQTVTEATYSQYSKSGWKSNFDLPVIEWPRLNDTYSYDGKPGHTCANYRISKVIIHMPDGSVHELRKSDQPQNISYVDTSGTFYSVDGSRMRYESSDVDTGTLYMPDGTRYFLDPTGSSITDRNGNSMSYSASTGLWTDTLGRTFANPLPANPTANSTTTYTLPGIPGTAEDELTYQLKWKNLADVLTPDESSNVPDLRYVAAEYLPYPTAPAVGYPSYTNYPTAQSSAHGHIFASAYTYDADGNPSLLPTLLVGKDQPQNQLFNPVVLSEIVLPDGTKYVFTYNEYGEINKIVYPTSAFEKYEYETPTDPGEVNSGEPYLQAERRIKSRKLSVDGSGNDIQEWKYSQSDPHGVIRIIAPDNTRTEVVKAHAAPGGGTRYGFISSISGVVLERRMYSTSSNGLGGTLLRRELNEYGETAHGVTISGICGQTPYSYNKTAYRNPRLTRHTNLIFEGSGSALAQTSTYWYDTTYELSYGVDQTGEYTNGYVAVSHASAETDLITSISAGSMVKTKATIYMNDQNYRNLNILGLPIAIIISDSIGTVVSRSDVTYDESAYTYDGSPHGSPTTAKNWDSNKGAYTNPSAYLTTHSTFDQWGNQTGSTDAKGFVTTTVFDSTYHTFPVSITSPVPDSSGTYGSNTGSTTSNTYDPTTGLLLTSTDANSQTTTMEYHDPLFRLTKTTAPNGHQTITEYGAGMSEATRWVKAKSQIDTSSWSEAKSYFDGVGRTYKTEKTDSDGNIFMLTEFDNMGRVKRVSNPFRNVSSPSCSTNIQCTTSTYDDLGRVVTVTMPDPTSTPTTIQTEYGLSTSGIIGATKKVTDQAGRKRKGITDVLGNVVQVIEDPDGTPLTTDYVFDLLGNVRKTTQGSQIRYFMCDSLGRVLYSRHVEQGVNGAFSGAGYADPITGNNQWAIKFEYDDNGNVARTTDAAGGYIDATYDRLNRLTFRNYSDANTPDVTFYYDGTGLGSAPSYSKGKTTKITSSASENRYTSFDTMGHLLSSQQITDGQTYNFGYAYNLSGGLVEETYPSGRVVKNTLNQDGQLAQVQSKKNSGTGFGTYAGSFAYNAAGTVTKMQLGNGKWETASYNERLQVTQIGLGSTDSTQDLLKLEFGYTTSTGGNDNNGSMKSQKITVPTVGSYTGFTATQTYTYDGLNRLYDATEQISSATSWKQTFDYDRYGNRKFNTTGGNTTTIPGGCSAAICNPTFDAGSNRFSSGQGYTYNANGAVTQDATGQRFGYDAENRQNAYFLAGNGGSTPDAVYYYDGNGNRTKKISATETTVFVYDSGGKLAAEYSTALASSPQVNYLTVDHLGSSRVTTNAAGAVIARKDFSAFGERTVTSQRVSGLGYTSVTGEPRQDYAGYQKDDETGLEYAQARYYNAGHGRFTSVDPMTSSGTIKNPQTFNRYSYVVNNPYKFVDPLGLTLMDAGIFLTSDATLPGKLDRVWRFLFNKRQNSTNRSQQTRTPEQQHELMHQQQQTQDLETQLRSQFPTLSQTDGATVNAAITDAQNATSPDTAFSIILTAKFRTSNSTSKTPSDALSNIVASTASSITITRDAAGQVTEASANTNAIYDGRTSTLMVDGDNNASTPEISVAKFFKDNPTVNAITYSGFTFVGAGFFSQDANGKAKSIVHERVVHAGFGRQDTEFGPTRREGSYAINAVIDRYYQHRDPPVIQTTPTTINTTITPRTP